MSARLRPLLILVVVWTTLWATQALACPVCVDAQDENRVAFVQTTWLLTFLPLLMIGGLLWWMRKKVLAARRLEASAEPQA